ncbi:MAG: MFS transporter [Microthrixaceae bacterium]|nr:MFS transporter [Microthrixaceae bacterium]MCB1012312.1 MFS transporter [Microthrixaceae bacterium]MCO5322643.1 MFS transporter [Microthrixaceae bacterium]
MTRLRAFGRSTFSSLSQRNFRLFFLGQGVSQIGNWMTLVTQTLLVLSLTDSGVALGLLAAAQFGPVLLLGPWAGLIADRSDKRRLLLLVQSVSMVQSLALAALAFSGEPPVWAVYALASVGGVTVAFDNPARRSMVVEMVDEDQVPNAVALNTTMMTSSRIVGPALGGLLVATAGFGAAFLVDGISYVAVLASLVMIRSADLRRANPAKRGRGQVREGLRYIRSEPNLFVPMVMMGVVGMLAFNFSTVLPLFAVRDLGGTEATYTYLFSILSVGALAGSLMAARRKVVTVTTVGRTAVAFGISMFALALTPGLATATIVSVFLGASSVGFLTASTAIVQLRSVPEMRGRVLAIQAMLFLGSTPIGGPLIGWLSEELGARAGMLVGAAGTLLAGAWGLAMVGRPKRNHPGQGAPTPVAP